MKQLSFLITLVFLCGHVLAADPEFFDVFKAGEHGYASIRIPSVIVTKAGTVLAFAEGRRVAKDQAANHIILKRSTDGGATWRDLQVIQADGANSLNNPTAVEERASGRILVMYQRYPAHASEFAAALEPGLSGSNVLRNYLITSDDDGLTWNTPRDLTASTKRPEKVPTVASGPGIGIQLTRGPHAGRLIMPFNEGPRHLWNVYAVFSDDAGATWQMGEVAPGALVTNTKGETVSRVNEVQMAELSDGSVLLNTRDNERTSNFRKVSVSHDGGQTWSAVREDRALNAPPCAAGVLRYDFGKDGAAGLLLYSGPDSSTRRQLGTVRLSRDDGATWPVKRLLVNGFFGYSVLTRLPDGRIGCLFETGQTNAAERIMFARFSTDWLTAPASKPAPRAAGAKGRPNIVVIVAEDHGSQLSCYGDPNIRTPNLDRIAAAGVRFANAFVTFSVCSPSRASLFTGLYPQQHGQIGLATHKYAMFQDWPNLPSLLKQAGYRTGIIGKLHVNPEGAFPFDFRALPTGNFDHRFMSEFTGEAAKFICASPEPFFLFLAYPDAHAPFLRQQDGLPAKPLTAADLKSGLPFIGADTPRIRAQIANYYNCLLRLDAGVGMLLNLLEEEECATNTLVVYLADHGPQFSRGKTSVYEAGLKVPMLLRWPARVKPGQVRTELVNEIDVLPTVLEAADLAARPELPGRSLLALNDAKKPATWRRYAFAWQTGGATPFWTFPQITVRDERYKLIQNLAPERQNPCVASYHTHLNAFFVAGTEPAELASAPAQIQEAYRVWQYPPAVELYDLQTDPYEFSNLAAEPGLAPVRARLLAAVKEWQKETGDPFADSAKLAAYLRETEEVNQKYGGSRSGYQQDEQFRWGYLDYLQPAKVARP